MFENWFYPDNENRANRAGELANDCAIISAALVQDKQTVESLLDQSTKAIQDAYRNLTQSDVPVQPVSLDKDHWVQKIASVISPIVAMERTMVALQAASRAWLLNQGRIGEAAFGDFVGLPRWLRFGKIMGGIAAAAAVEAVVDAISGADNRHALQKAVNDLKQPRIALKQHALVNERVRLSLTAVIDSYDAIRNIPGITKEQLDAIVTNLISQHKVHVEEITDQFAMSKLAELDNQRGSWTAEG
ncbi:hypothetical protein [Methylobacterium nigriterrae]|uniref:hypothetical protein n=1 Tax=Methylobacterium nigriterrae TaxID=3127512 RepID=UPI0030141020